jgi:predicted N-acyltransferase
VTGLEVRWHDSLDQVAPEAWNALFPGLPEDWHFYRAIEDAPPEGFALGAVVARSGEGRVVAAVPGFALSYRLDTPFQGRLRRIGDAIHRRLPRLTSLAVVGLGSPLSDNCSVGFAEGLSPEAREIVFEAMLRHLRGEAARRGAAIVAVKGLVADEPPFAGPLARDAFNRVRSVPVVVLPMPHASLDAYLASLARRYRSYFRSKMKTLPQLRIEWRDSAAGVENTLVALYEATLARSGVSYGDFDRIGPDYFGHFLARQGDRARLLLFWRGNELVGFHLLHIAQKRIISNKMGMRYPDARELNLYFINWLKIIELAAERGVKEIEMGATTYAAKLLFGGHLESRLIYFRFRNGLINRLCRPLAPLFDFERNDPELARLASEARRAQAVAAS